MQIYTFVVDILLKFDFLIYFETIEISIQRNILAAKISSKNVKSLFILIFFFGN